MYMQQYYATLSWGHLQKRVESQGLKKVSFWQIYQNLRNSSAKRMGVKTPVLTDECEVFKAKHEKTIRDCVRPCRA